MHRPAGFVLTLLGAFVFVAAVVLRFWIVPEAIKYPLNEFEVVHLTGSGSYFSATAGKERTRASIEITTTVKGNVVSGNDSTAVWDFFTYVYDRTNRQAISFPSWREAFDRKTGELVNCCGTYVTAPTSGLRDYSVHMSGLGPLFPMGTKPTTQVIFDVTAARPEPARYEGTASINGIVTDKFVEKVSPTKIGTAGSLGLYYSTTSTYYVDPVTGAPLDTAESPTVTLGSSPSDVQVLASTMSVTETAASIESVVATDKTARTELTLVKTALPVTGAVVGIALLLLGIVVLRRRSADTDRPGMHRLLRAPWLQTRYGMPRAWQGIRRPAPGWEEAAPGWEEAAPGWEDQPADWEEAAPGWYKPSRQEGTGLPAWSAPRSPDDGREGPLVPELPYLAPAAPAWQAPET